MRERVRDDVALRLALEAVVADGCGGLQGFVYIADFEQAALLRVMRPHARVEICL